MFAVNSRLIGHKTIHYNHKSNKKYIVRKNFGCNEVL